jgi:hypothetical protein
MIAIGSRDKDSNTAPSFNNPFSFERIVGPLNRIGIDANLHCHSTKRWQDLPRPVDIGIDRLPELVCDLPKYRRRTLWVNQHS